MPSFSANLTMCQEVPFLGRFSAAARAGFKAVEFVFPYDYPVTDLQRELITNGLRLVLFNMPAGDLAAGERGIAVDPSRRAEFRSAVLLAVEYSEAFGVPQVNCLVGKKLTGVAQSQQRQAMVENQRFAAETFGAAGASVDSLG